MLFNIIVHKLCYSTLYENIPDYLTEGVDYIKCSHIEE